MRQPGERYKCATVGKQTRKRDEKDEVSRVATSEVGGIEGGPAIEEGRGRVLPITDDREGMAVVPRG